MASALDDTLLLEDVIPGGDTLTPNQSASMPVETYLLLLRKLADFDQLVKCRISKVEHRKDRDGSEHEFLCAYMEVDGSRGSVYRRSVILQRSPRLVENATLVRQTMQHKIIAKGFGVDGADTIQFFIYLDLNRSSSVLYTLEFKTRDRQPTIIDLACLANTVTSFARKYKMYKFSCYWYSRMVYEGLRIGNNKFRGGIVTLGPISKKRGTWKGYRVVNDFGQLILSSEDTDTGDMVALELVEPDGVAPSDDSDDVSLVQAAGDTPSDPIKVVMGRFRTHLQGLLEALRENTREKERKQEEEIKRRVAEIMGSTMLSDDVTLPPHSISTRLELLPQQSEIGEGLQIGKHDLNSKLDEAKKLLKEQEEEIGELRAILSRREEGNESDRQQRAVTPLDGTLLDPDAMIVSGSTLLPISSAPTPADKSLGDYKLDLNPEDMIICGSTLLPLGTSYVAIKEYCQALEGSSTFEQLQLCQITRLEHRKFLEGSQHEFILAYMHATGISSGEDYARWVTLERVPSSEGRRFWNFPFQKMLKLGGRVPAQDSLRITTEEDLDLIKGTSLLYSLDFPESSGAKPPTIIDIAFLAKMLSGIAEEYELYTFSCYWFARMLFDGCAAGSDDFGGGIVKAEKHATKRGKWGKHAFVNDYGQLILESELIAQKQRRKSDGSSKRGGWGMYSRKAAPAMSGSESEQPKLSPEPETLDLESDAPRISSAGPDPAKYRDMEEPTRPESRPYAIRAGDSDGSQLLQSGRLSPIEKIMSDFKIEVERVKGVVRGREARERDNKIQLEAKRRQEADEQARITESHKREVEARDETRLQLIEALTEGEQLQAPILA